MGEPWSAGLWMMEDAGLIAEGAEICHLGLKGVTGMTEVTLCFKVGLQARDSSHDIPSQASVCLLWGPLQKHAHPMYNPVTSLIFRCWNCPGISHVIWESTICHREEMNYFHRKRKKLIFNKLLAWALIILPNSNPPQGRMIPEHKWAIWEELQVFPCPGSGVLSVILWFRGFWVLIALDLVSRTWWLPGLRDTHLLDLESCSLTIL